MSEIQTPVPEQFDPELAVQSLFLLGPEDLRDRLQAVGVASYDRPEPFVATVDDKLINLKTAESQKKTTYFLISDGSKTTRFTTGVDKGNAEVSVVVNYAPDGTIQPWHKLEPDPTRNRREVPLEQVDHTHLKGLVMAERELWEQQQRTERGRGMLGRMRRQNPRGVIKNWAAVDMVSSVEAGLRGDKSAGNR